MKARILAVAYDSGLLQGRQLLLEHAGYEIVTALGTVEAARYSRERFDLILLGYTMSQGAQRTVIELRRACGCSAPVVTMLLPGQIAIEGAVGIEPDPDLLLKTVKQLIPPSTAYGE